MAEVRGRKIDEIRERESCAPEREGAESQVRDEREKIIKILYAHVTVTVQICTVAICIYT